jgi:Ca2+:H+ antiporter
MASYDPAAKRFAKWWPLVAPLAAAGFVAAIFVGAVEKVGVVTPAIAIVLLFAAVFAAVHHAAVLAVKVGEPFGSILLALSITALEVGLILAVMIGGSVGSEAVARDTVFSVVMLVVNGVVGLCLVLGGARYRQQEFLVQGAKGMLSVVITLSVIVLVLPNFTLTTEGPTYASTQLLFVGGASLALYVVFVFVQTIRHRDHFVIDFGMPQDSPVPTAPVTATSAVLMIVSLASVILLAKTLTPTLEAGVAAAGLPHGVVGVLIAILVLLPEGITAVNAARRNDLQTALNLSLGSAAASIGLTVPIVGTASVLLGLPLVLGLAPDDLAMLALTFLVAMLSLGTGRTTILPGAVHLVILGMFLLLSAVP